MSWRTGFLGLISACALAAWSQGVWAVPAAPAQQQFEQSATAPAAPAITTRFDAERATAAYMATMSTKAKERSDRYFEGGYWLILWDFLVVLAVALAVASGVRLDAHQRSTEIQSFFKIDGSTLHMFVRVPLETISDAQLPLTPGGTLDLEGSRQKPMAAVAAVQVIGVPDVRMGEELMAWVVFRDGNEATEDEMRAFCREQLAHFKVPRYWKFAADFPMTVTGKVQKFKMRETAIAELGLASAAAIRTA